MNCPVCNIPLTMTERQGVLIFVRNVAVYGLIEASWIRLSNVQHRKCLPGPIRNDRMSAMISATKSITMIITVIITKRNEGFCTIYSTKRKKVRLHGYATP